MSGLPGNWVVLPIGDLISLNPKIECSDELSAGFVPMQMVGKEYSSPIRFETRPWGEIKKGYTHFSNGDVLLAKITPCFENGKAGLVCGLPNGVGAGSTEYFVSRPHLDMLNSRYLYAFLKTDKFLKAGAVQMTGSVGHKRVPKDYLLETELPLAPLNEQKRIADKLDAVLARVDACRDRLDRIPAILKRFRQSVLAAATSGKLTEDWRATFKPSEWNTQPLADICLSITDGDHQAPPQAETGIPFITISAINDGQLRLEKASRFVPVAYFDALKESRRPQRGDILFSVTGSIGIPAMVDTDSAFTFQRHIAILRPDHAKISSSYLKFVLGAEGVQQQALAVATGTAQLTIPLTGLRSFRVEVPSTEEQTEIVHRIEALFAYADRLEARHTAARAQVEKLTPSTLSKAFRGELVPQDPNDEPASKLLELIR
ncbi:MAG: restriction endonuclease subunit S [Candidatus Nitrotoga sp.]